MKRAKKHIHLLSIYERLNNQQKKNVQKFLDNDQVKFICEIAINLLKGNLPVNCKTKEKLKKYKGKIRKLACSGPLKAKKKILQVGGFFPALLGILGQAAVGSLLQKLISSTQDG